MIRFSRVFKKLIQKGFVYVGDQSKEKKKIRRHYTITVNKKMYDNLLDTLMSKRFKVKT
jgi:DNA-binding transcriptional regulator of glucitol operon